MSQIKQVIVYRRDLNMRKGKIAAQCAHAVMKVFFDRGSIAHLSTGPFLMVPLTEDMASWVEGLFTKIVLTVETEADLLRVHELAKEADLPCALITDAGQTEFKAPCEWCGGRGSVDEVFGAPICGYCKGTGRINVPTSTTVAIGPARAEDIDKITGPEGAISTKLP